MRCAIIYPHLNLGLNSPPGDALAVLITELGRRLGRNDQVIVFGNRRWGAAGRVSLDGIELRRLPVGPDRLLGQLHRLDGLLFTNPALPFRSSRLYYPFFGRQVARAARRESFDVIHVHAVPNLLPALRASAPSAKIVFHAHDHRLTQYSRARTMRYLEAADLILACSRFVAEAIRKRYTALAGRCHHLYNGADDRFFRIAPSKSDSAVRILFVGRLSPEKGVHTLLQAFTAVAGRSTRAVLDIVGPPDVAPFEFVDPMRADPQFQTLRPFYRTPGTYRHYLRKLVPKELTHRVRFWGPQPNALLPQIYRQADVFVFPSIWHEPFGMPVVEAMASGLPVIATRSGAFPETVQDGRTGLLVARGDAEALALALMHLIDAPRLRREFGAAGRQRALQEFHWDPIVRELRCFYRRLLEASPESGLQWSEGGRDPCPPAKRTH